jgi:TPR repeat protein
MTARKSAKAVAAAHIAEGKKLWEQERFFEGYLQFLRSIQADPHFPEAIFCMGEFCSWYGLLYEASGGAAGIWAGVSVAPGAMRGYYLRAALLGFAEAQYALFHELRKEARAGNPIAEMEAEVWLHRAAMQEHAGACEALEERILSARMNQCKRAIEQGDLEAERYYEWVDLFGLEFIVQWSPWQFTDEWLAGYQSLSPAEQAKTPLWWIVRLPEPEGAEEPSPAHDLPAEKADEEVPANKRDVAPAIAGALRSCYTAAVNGHLEAQMILGDLYRKGQVSCEEHHVVEPLLPLGEKDLSFFSCHDYPALGSKQVAAYWYGKAALQGSEAAAAALAELEPLLLLEEAKRIVFRSQSHYNFGNNIEARKHYYTRLGNAVKLLRDAGYRVEHKGFGYKLEMLQ